MLYSEEEGINSDEDYFSSALKAISKANGNNIRTLRHVFSMVVIWSLEISQSYHYAVGSRSLR